jgi:hypothetical protein
VGRIAHDPKKPSDVIGVPLLCEIQYLKPGVEVLSRCEETGEITYKKILKVFEHSLDPKDDAPYFTEEESDHFDLGFYSEDPGWRGGGDGFYVTGAHRIWVQDKGWVRARDLQVGDEFLAYDGSSARLTSKKKELYPMNVYNLAAEDFHTYSVAEASIWVHNTKMVEIHDEGLRHAVDAKRVSGMRRSNSRGR